MNGHGNENVQNGVDEDKDFIQFVQEVEGIKIEQKTVEEKVDDHEILIKLLQKDIQELRKEIARLKTEREYDIKVKVVPILTIDTDEDEHNSC